MNFPEPNKSTILMLETIGSLKRLNLMYPKGLKKGTTKLIKSNLPDDTLVLITDYEARLMTEEESKVLLDLLEPSKY